MFRLMLALIISSSAVAAFAEEPVSEVIAPPATDVPVYTTDKLDRPYEIIGEVRAGVRKLTPFSSRPSEAKIYRNLWERARKLGADAVINAQYGENRGSLTSYGTTEATGTAVRFVKAPESAE